MCSYLLLEMRKIQTSCDFNVYSPETSKVKHLRKLISKSWFDQSNGKNWLEWVSRKRSCDESNAYFLVPVGVSQPSLVVTL